MTEKELIERLTQAYETGDVEGIIALFTDDAWLAMPPPPPEYQGRDMIGHFLAEIAFRGGRTYRLVPARPAGSSPSAPTCTARQPRPARRAGCWCSPSAATRSAR